MRNKLLIGLSLVGILAGTASAYFFSLTKPPLSPVFNPAGRSRVAEHFVSVGSSRSESWP